MTLLYLVSKSGIMKIRCMQTASFSKVTKVGTKWRSAVGLEIHAQINTVSKLFSGASTSFSFPVNSNVSNFDAAVPGTLPVLNKQCVESGILTALALSCKLNPVSTFDRKHYFYADLPAGYQITQQKAPLACDGLVLFQVSIPQVNNEPYSKASKLKQIQLEQDSGKSLHDNFSQRSLIDFNRAGLPLMELVFEPDLSNGEEAAALVKELILIFSRINTCSCKMEEGAMRVDANISVNKEGQSLGVRTEIKNIGSIRAVAHAVDYEVSRQIREIESGRLIFNETRAWDVERGITVPMRDKEVKQDYRFMPEPNLPPLRINVSKIEVPDMINVEKIKKLMPELPGETRKKLSDFGITKTMQFLLMNEETLLQLFNEIMQHKPSRDPKQVAKLITIELMTLMNKNLVKMDLDSLRNYNIGQIADLLEAKKINLLSAKTVLLEIANGNISNPVQIVENMNLWIIDDHNELVKLCKKALVDNPKIVIKYREGKSSVFASLLGYIAKATNRRANMEKVSIILKDLLK